MMKAVRLFILLSIFSLRLFAQNTERDWSLQGYVKDMVTVSTLEGMDSALFDNLIHNRLNFAWNPSDRFSANIELRTRIFTGDAVNITPNYSGLIDVNDDYFDLSVIPIDEEKIVMHSVLDRAYFSYKFEDWQVSIGRQRINWGINLAWNPNDIFNAYSFFDFDYEERPGSDAIRFQKFIGYAGGYELAIKITDNFEDLTAAGIYKWNKSEYDMQVLAGVMREQLVAGGGWAGNIKLIGFKGELTYLKDVNSNRSDFLGSTSLDYAFANSLYLNMGMLYNSASNPNALFQQSSANLDIRSLSPFEWSVFSQVSYPVHPLLTAAVATLVFPGEEGVFINPTLTYSIISNLDFDAIGQVYLTNSSQSAYFLFARLKYSF